MLFSTMLFLLVFAGFLFDLKSVSQEIMGPLAALSFLIVVLSFRFEDSGILRFLFILLLFVTVEWNFLLKPKAFHVIIYWLPFIPITALLIQGTRAAILWVFIVLLGHTFNLLVLEQNVGTSYPITIHTTPFYVAGFIFLFGVVSVSLLLYTLLGGAYEKMKEKNEELERVKREIERQKNEIQAMNESLEENVRIRTHELQKQNAQLSEYAFINSHLLRAPLSRILGLSDVLVKETTSLQDSKLIEALSDSSHELDNIIRKIGDILHDGNNLNREDIQSLLKNQDGKMNE